MQYSKTERGFERVDFKDTNSRECSLQQSSSTDHNYWQTALPGTSFLWLGRGDERMHLDRGQVEELRDRLAAWLETGSIRIDADGEDAVHAR